MQCIVSMLSVCIGSNLKSVKRYKFLILYTYHHLYAQYLREQGCEDQWLFVGIERAPLAKSLGNTGPNFYSLNQPLFTGTNCQTSFVTGKQSHKS